MTSLILRFISKFGGLFGQGKANREFDDEVETHIELLTERLIRQGMSREDAFCAARRQFGNTALLEQRQREARSFLWPATVLQDVRYGLRMFAKSPGVTAIAITSLALGIGANTAIFTLAKAALFDTLSVPHPGELRLLAYSQDDRSVIRQAKIVSSHAMNIRAVATLFPTNFLAAESGSVPTRNEKFDLTGLRNFDDYRAGRGCGQRRRSQRSQNSTTFPRS